MRRHFVALVLAVGSLALVAGAPAAAELDSPEGSAPSAPPAAAEEEVAEALFVGSPWFRPGRPYADNFPDPAVLVDGGTAYAYATSTGGVHLPVAASTDLVTWTARQPYVPDPYPDPVFDPHFNDALVTLPAWANLLDTGHPHIRTEVWAPGVARVADRYLAYLTVQDEPAGPGLPTRHCITVAVADDPLGPFRDASGATPLVCDADPAGSIDADPFVDADGTPYLLWKSEGVPGRVPPRLWIRRLDASGTAFAAGSAAVELLRPGQWWQGRTVENPSMARLGDRYLLFYSANDWRRRAYAVGVAECDTPTGPCRPQGDWPVLGTRDGLVGPGGADAFVGADGVLRLAFHAWTDPWVGYPDPGQCLAAGTCASQGQRRLHVLPVTVAADGRVGVGADLAPVTGYTAEEFASLAWAAGEVGADPEYLQRFGVYAAAFLLHIGNRSAVREPLEPPSVAGPAPIRSWWPTTERPVLDWVGDHFAIGPEQTQKLGATLMVFLTAISRSP